jgi:hypothetical protein
LGLSIGTGLGGRPGRPRLAILLSLALLGAALPAGDALAAPPDPGGFRQDDFGGGSVFNIVPPGQNGTITAPQAAAFLATGARPPHQYDQQDMYANLVHAAPGLRRSQILDYFKDASFGVRSGDVERNYTPNCAIVVPPSATSTHCDDVRIVRDGFGIPHVYGADRAALMFGLGYVTGEDRLFLADVLRHAGRADVSSFVGGSEGNREQDRATFAAAPYASDAELQTQYEQGDELYGADGVQVQQDVQNYVDGMNQWIAETRADPTKLDALYAATNHPTGPEPWDVTDIVATGTLVAGIFGQGGGGELNAAIALQQARRVFGRRRGGRVWRDFLSVDDPEAPTTIHGKRFPYRVPNGKRGIAMPDRGTVRFLDVVSGGTPRASEPQRSSEGGILEGLLEKSGASSNALLVSARESRGGHPVAVMGPQTGYFAPQLLMEEDAHAPAGPEGPGIDARGVAFVGTNLYVQLGRGRDYAWSATSAGQDIIDTFAVRLCEPGGGTPTRNSRNYIWNGQCIAMDELSHTNAWAPNAADPTPPGTETLTAYRTNVGILAATATIKGRPFGYTKLRATYKREVDAAGAFADWNSPQKIHGPRDFFRSGYKNDLTFNWFYIDDKNIAYYNSGANPVRAPRTPATFPVHARSQFLWRGFNPELNTFRRQSLRSHPQVINQRFLTSWNNKQARGVRCDDIRCYTPVHRSQRLDQRVKAGIRGARKMSLVKLINAMEDAGTVDVRGAKVVPLALRVIKGPRGRLPGARLRRAVRTMRAWVRTGAHRRDRNDNGSYEHAAAVKTMDAWWPLWVGGEFTPTLGKRLKRVLIGSGTAIHDAPGPTGSAFLNNTYGFPNKDLRMLLARHGMARRVKGPYSRVYCGRGKLRRCRRMLRRTLVKASRKSFASLYGSEGCELTNGTNASPQMCHDAVDPTDVTVASVGKFHWIDRPTFQQAIRYPSGR